jgi:hypothetical protein
MSILALWMNLLTCFPIDYSHPLVASASRDPTESICFGDSFQLDLHISRGIDHTRLNQQHCLEDVDLLCDLQRSVRAAHILLLP